MMLGTHRSERLTQLRLKESSACSSHPSAYAQGTELEGTFSIIARDPATGELGMTVQSKTLAVGSRTITIKGGVAVIAHQSSSNPMYGALGLELLAAGMSPQQALDMMIRGDEGRDSPGCHPRCDGSNRRVYRHGAR
jgi:hypothetical protein